MAYALLGLAVSANVAAQSENEADPKLTTLAEEFDAWLAINQPSGPFASLRITRPAGWQPDWSRTALQKRKTEFLQFQARLKALNHYLTKTADQIDAALLGAAMARVYWELEVLASPRRDPGFALNQTLGSVFELLVQSPEPNESEIVELITRLKKFPAVINAAKLELVGSVAVLADASLSRTGDVDVKMDSLEQALADYVPEHLQGEFAQGIRAARQSLTSYKDWLTISHARFDGPVSIGEQRLRWYLGHVALVPRSPESILVETELVLAQTGAQLALDNQRFSQSPAANQLESLDRLLLMLEISRSELQTYLGNIGVVSLPENLSGIEYSALPPTLVPIANMGEPLTFSPDDVPWRRYLNSPENSVEYREQLMWIEPRILLTWEALPGLAMQADRAFLNPRQLRRQATGPAIGRGISLYFHEQLSSAGLYAFNPVSHQLAVKFVSYCAALAQADIRLARGDWRFRDAAAFVQQTVDRNEAGVEADILNLIAHPGIAAASFATFGQIVRYLADAARLSGGKFSLQDFNDRLLLNAHVPVALQRWEHLGLEDELDELLEQRGRPATVPQ